MRMGRQIKSGGGWRIGWNDEATPYRGLVGGDRWSVELTDTEFKDFCRLIQELDDAMQQIACELMDSEKVSCEAESEYVWLEAEGYPHAYDVHFILQQGRQAEGEWPASVIAEIIPACKLMATVAEAESSLPIF
jgi:hypothetical protein